MKTIDEIKYLYHHTTKATVQRDLTRAVALLKTLATEEERESVAVYMDGLSQMRSEWGVRPVAPKAPSQASPGARRTARAGTSAGSGGRRPRR